MKKVTEKSKGEYSFRKMQEKTILAFCLIVVIITCFLAVVIMSKSAIAIRDNASGLVNANSRQIQLNINSYLNKVEVTSALLFSDERYYEYDATDESIDEYTRIQYESGILDRIVDLGIMENFSDFGIIYANDNTVGWISNTTKDSFDKGTMYESFVPYITNEKTSDGWFFGIGGNTDRLFYIKRLNPNAVLVASIYNRELAKVFEFPEELNGMIIRLINDDNQILYSSNKDEIGFYVPEDIVARISGNDKISIANDDYIINVNTCNNGWRVVCFIPASLILSDIASLKNFTFTTSIFLAAVFVLIGLFIFGRFAKPMDSVVSSLENQANHDGLTGLLNKISFEDVVSSSLKKTQKNSTITMIIIDVDHFKMVNDTFGHEYGDKVIVRTSDVIKRVFSAEILTGRIGGDEFAAFYSSNLYDSEHIIPVIERNLDELSKEFNKEFAKERDKIDISLSIGVLVMPYASQEFRDIYRMADSALYKSKESGRNRYTFYREDSVNE